MNVSSISVRFKPYFERSEEELPEVTSPEVTWPEAARTGGGRVWLTSQNK